MKKLLIFIFFITSFAGFSQAVTIDATKTPTQLVNDILINSLCFNATAVTASSGNTFGSTNGIGYFENYNDNFPFTSGVVLTTGNVTRVPSPNNVVLSDGTLAWPGDEDLEDALAPAGIVLNSVNATSLEFDFVASATTFDLAFVFASEEYGTSQCNFSDAFAFLIKNVTTGSNYSNIAVVGESNEPVSVQTIRNNLYNPNCPSANPSFFGAYNTPGFGPAINFNGQTIKMTASSTLVVGNTYHVKLVVADGGDNVGYDSAIFLEAKSLNIGQNVLGIDYVAANANDPVTPRNGYCPGSVLPTLQANATPVLPAGTTYVWKRNGANFSPAQTGTTLNLNTITPTPVVGFNNYSLTYTQPGCTPITDDITVEIFPNIDALDIVSSIYKCTIAGATNYDFDLTINDEVIFEGNDTNGPGDNLPADTEITYHLSPGAANANTGVLPDIYTITAAQALIGFPIYARITNPNTGCWEVRSFTLNRVPPPTLGGIPADLSLCALSTAIPARATFDFAPIYNLVLGSNNPATTLITYHTSQANANIGGNAGPISPIGGPDGTYNSVSRPVWIRVQNITDPTCFVVSSAPFQLIVTPLPLVNILPDVRVCVSFTLPALTDPNMQYWSGINPTTGDPVAPQRFAGDVITPTGTTTLYVFNQSGDCRNSDSFRIIKSNLDAITPASASFCETVGFILPPLPYGGYWTLAGGPATPGNTPRNPGENINTVGPNTLHVWFENPTEVPTCGQNKPFTITILPFTPLPTNYENQFACNSYNLLADTNGGTYYNGPNKTGGVRLPGAINTPGPTTIYVYKESNTVPNCTSEQTFTVFIGITNINPPASVTSCSTYTLPALTVGEYRTQAAGAGSVIPEGTPITTTTQIWYYVQGQNCTDNLNFTVTINLAPLPAMPNVGPICDEYVLPPVAHAGSYFSGPNGTGQNLDGLSIVNPGVNTVYFYDRFPGGSCFVQNMFTVTIDSSPAIDARPIEVITCNTCHTLDDLTNGEYYKLPGGPTNTSPSQQLLPAGTQICTNTTTADYTTIYVYSGSPVVGNTCFQEYSIDIYNVNTNITPIADVYACDSYVLPAIVGPGDYWSAAGGPNGGGAIVPVGTVVTTNTTFYVYYENNNRVTCSSEDTFAVTIYTTPVVASIPSEEECDSFLLPALVAPATRYFTLPGGPSNPLNVEKFVGDAITTSQTVYAYAESGTIATQICFDEEPLVITINNTPNIPAITPVFACDSYALPAYPAPATKYFTANDGTGTELFPNDPITASQTIYAYAETATTPNCSEYEPFAITIYNTPVVASILSVEKCDSFLLPALVAPATRYFTLPGGPSNPLNVEKFVGNAITASQTVYAYAESGTIATQICFDEEPLVITINNTPNIPAITPVFACDSYALPAYPAPATKYFTANDGTGTELFPNDPITTTQTIYAYAETATTPNCSEYEPFIININYTPVFNASEVADVNTCNSYTLPALTTPNAKYYTQANGSGTIIPVNTVFTTSQVIYAYAVNGAGPNTCASANEDIVINIYNVDEIANITNCGTVTLPALSAPNAQYYLQPNGTGAPVTQISQLGVNNVYVYGISPFSTCADVWPFTVTINASAVANPVPDPLRRICDVDSNVDDNVTDFNLDSLTSTILGAQDPTFYQVEYFPSLPDAAAGTNKITTDAGLLTDTRLSTVYAKVSDGTNSGCEDIEPITIIVVPFPHEDPNNPISGIICTNVDTGLVGLLEPINPPFNYAAPNYLFSWRDSAGIELSSAYNFEPPSGGNYSLVITATGVSGCESLPIDFTVIESSRPIDVIFETVGMFTDNQTVTVLTTPVDTGGLFLYSLDGQTPQTTNVFTNVSSGVHEITVSDVNGCGSLPLPIPLQLVNSPKFFSPNGDGVNDKWRIVGLENQVNSQLFIYDRYGKLLSQQFVNSGDGWDGTVNGQPLPGNDYWFTITYVENGVAKEFKSHFSLVR